MTPDYPISQAAQRAGATVHQVRTYVAAGLVKPCATTAGGHFLFNEECVARLRLIAAATRAGLRISEIGVLVKALEGTNPRAVRAARRSVGNAIGAREAAIQHLHALVAHTDGTAIPGRETGRVARDLISRTRLERQTEASKQNTARDHVHHRMSMR